MSVITFDRAKASVGLSNFVEFYEDYRKYYEQQSTTLKRDKKHLAKKLLDSNPKATSITGQYTRINYTVAIFSNKWEKEMLKATIESNHHAVSKETKAKARDLLHHYQP
ncbi:hypothetical protein ACFOLF_18175 [Paenibacillus sepulcri]|uniref:Uncharacterized protein n=1 Tax=Paenibacillus sepulcri TaxID=359917 RepID=A0ABS7C1X1_9BACL|nr:hypothetical protein [Paenibacillus sepulcri]